MSNFKQIAGAIVGGTIGFFTPVFGGGPWGALKGAAFGYSLGAAFTTTELDTVEAPRVEELGVQKADYGAVINQVYGQDEVAGTVIWIKGNAIEEVEHREKVKTGGKGGGSKQTVISFTYQVTMLIVLTDHLLGGVQKIYGDNVLIYDASGNDPVGKAESEDFAESIEFLNEGSSQSLIDLLEAEKGSDIPAFRNVSLVLFTNLQLAEFGNRIPTLRFVIADSESARSLPPQELNVSVAGEMSRGVLLPVLETATKVGTFPAVYNAGVLLAYKLKYDALTIGDYTNVPLIIKQVIDGVNTDDVLIETVVKFDASTLSYGLYNNDMNVSGVEIHPITNSNNALVIYAHAVGVWKMDLFIDYQVCVNIRLPEATLTLLKANRIAIATGSKVYIISTGVDGLIELEVPSLGAVADADYQERPIWITPRVGLTRLYRSLGVSNLTGDVFTVDYSTGQTLYKMDGIREEYSVNLGNTSRAANLGEMFISRKGTSVSYQLALSQTTMATVNLDEQAIVSTTDSTIFTGQIVVVYYSPEVAFIRRLRNPLVSYATISQKFLHLGMNFTETDNITTEVAIKRILSNNEYVVGNDFAFNIQEDRLQGYTLNNRASSLGKLRPLMQAYQLVGTESDYKIKIKSRALNASIATITTEDIQAHEIGQDIPEQAVIISKSDIDVPARVNISYRDSDKEFESSIQYSERSGTISNAEYDVSLPMSLTANKAKQISEIFLNDAILESKGVISFLTHFKYSHLEIEDMITLVTDYNTFTCVIIDKEMGKPGIVRISATLNKVENYSSTAVGEAGSRTNATITPTPDSFLVTFDTVPLRDSDLDYGFYYGVYPMRAAGWGGAQVAASRDGMQWTAVSQLFNAVSAGTGVGKLTSAASPWVYDQSETLNVVMAHGTLSSATEVQVMSNLANIVIYGQPGRWEVFKFITATLEANGTYTLSNLLRGYWGTHHNMNNHEVNDQCIFIDSDTIRRYGLLSQDDFENLFLLKATSFGRVFTDVGSTSMAAEGESLTKRAPGVIGATRDSSGNITISFHKGLLQNREWTNVNWTTTEVSTFEIDVLSGAGGTLKRTITATGSNAPFTASYTSAQQITDFGSNRTSLYINIYETDVVTGRGVVGQGLGI